MNNIRLGTALLVFFYAACSRHFEKQTYRAVDDQLVLTLISEHEAELKANGINHVCQYSREGDKLRIVLKNELGAEQAIYLQVTPDGLKNDEDNDMLYAPKKYEEVMKEITAKRHQAKLNDSLLEAAEKGDAKAIDDLIKQGAQIDSKTKSGRSAYEVALRNCHPEVIEALLAHNSNTSVTSKDGTTPLMIAAANGFGEDRSPDCDKLLKLLIDHKANLDAQDSSGRTALMIALRERHLEAVKILVAAGANRTLRDANGKTVFDGYLSDKDKAALRTAAENKVLQASRTPTRKIGQYHEIKGSAGGKPITMRHAPNPRF